MEKNITDLRAEAFARILGEMNPDILLLMVMPLVQDIRRLAQNDDQESGALNIVLEFITQLNPFPAISKGTVEKVLHRLAAAPEYLCKAEVEIAAKARSDQIQAWSETVVVHEVKANLALSENDELIKRLAHFFWGIFACLRTPN